jgi:lipopolysaccharide export LptBFGC system permease protein LptF
MPRKAAVPVWLQQHRKVLLTGSLAAIGLFCLGAWLLKTFLPQPQAASTTEPQIGVIDVQKAMQVHDAYDELEKLREDARVLSADIALDKAQPLELTAPDTSSPAFQEMAQKQASHAGLKDGAAYKAKRQAAAKSWQDDNQAEYERIHDEVDGGYLNEILNIRLKLDNRDSMRLSDEAAEALENQLADLQQERGQKQRELMQRYQAALGKYLSDFDAKNRPALEQDIKAAKQHGESVALAKQSDAQARDAAAMQMSLAGKGREQRLQAKRAALQEKTEEIRTMEEHMMNDIAGKAAKLAIIHHLTLIVASRTAGSNPSFVSSIKDNGSDNSYVMQTVGADTIDLTDELLEEMKNQ